jgi:hypothetical protein
VPEPVTRRTLRPAATAAVGTAAVAGTALTAAEIAQQERQSRAASIRRNYATVEASAQLSDVFQDIGRFDSRLTALPSEVDEMRERGYVHAGQLEDQIAALDEAWDEVRPRVEQTLRAQVDMLNADLANARNIVSRMSANNSTSLNAAETNVNSLEQKINAARRAVNGLYDGLQTQLHDIDDAMDRVDWMLDQFETADVELRETEGPLAAGDAEWHRSGDEGPKGMLLLTDQRLLFEQREEVATKKVLGLITTDSETLKKMLVQFEVKHIDQFRDLEEKSGFLGMGKDEILEMVLSAEAQVSRARFHLLDQDSTAWAMLIRRVKSGEIDEDRAEEYLTEVGDADALAAAFPEQCPNCFGSMPEVPRGIASIVCEFCGSVVTASVPSPVDAK